MKYADSGIEYRWKASPSDVDDWHSFVGPAHYLALMADEFFDTSVIVDVANGPWFHSNVVYDPSFLCLYEKNGYLPVLNRHLQVADCST